MCPHCTAGDCARCLGVFRLNGKPRICGCWLTHRPRVTTEGDRS